MEKSTSYRDLIAWQQAMELVVAIYEVVKTFPDDERFGLTTQLRRAAISVVSNIAEGQGRGTKGEFALFLGHAKGSLCEVESQLLVAERLKYISNERLCAPLEQCERVSRLLNGPIRSMKPAAKGVSA